MWDLGAERGLEARAECAKNNSEPTRASRFVAVNAFLLIQKARNARATFDLGHLETLAMISHVRVKSLSDPSHWTVISATLLASRQRGDRQTAPRLHCAKKVAGSVTRQHDVTKHLGPCQPRLPDLARTAWVYFK